jgi:hypothetical protein
VFGRLVGYFLPCGWKLESALLQAFLIRKDLRVIAAGWAFMGTFDHQTWSFQTYNIPQKIHITQNKLVRRIPMFMSSFELEF